MVWHGTDLNEIKKLLPFDESENFVVSANSDFVLFCGPFPDWYTRVPYEYKSILNDFDEYCEVHFQKIGQSLSEAGLLKKKMSSVLRYTFTLNEIVRSILSEDMINVLHFPYLLEAMQDLDGGILLSLNGCYKQAHILLRSALETALAHYFYSASGVGYEDIIFKEDFRLPAFRFRPGNMLSSLQETKSIDDELFELLNNCYGCLNKFVHSSIDVLTVGVPWEEGRVEQKIVWWNKNACGVSHCLILLVISMLSKDV